MFSIFCVVTTEVFTSRSCHFMNHDNITDITTYLRAHAAELGARILESYPPLQSTKDPVAPRIATLLRKALPAQLPWVCEGETL
jgi:hypothetical protein